MGAQQFRSMKTHERGINMPIKYTRQQILDKIVQASSDMGQFYQQAFVNYVGKTSDTKEEYTEIVAEWLIQNPQYLHQIAPIRRRSSYRIQTHSGITPADDSNRLEERTAMAMFRQRGLPFLGLVIDYQTPLKDEISSKAGKIDLLTYDGSVLRILEMKNPLSKETMLRCVLEGFTYLKTADTGKLLQDFVLPVDTEVRTSPFVCKGGFQQLEMRSKRPYLRQLMEMLNCSPYYYEKVKTLYIVEQ